jgi:hypothetical protein
LRTLRRVTSGGLGGLNVIMVEATVTEIRRHGRRRRVAPASARTWPASAAR